MRVRSLSFKAVVQAAGLWRLEVCAAFGIVLARSFDLDLPVAAVEESAVVGAVVVFRHSIRRFSADGARGALPRGSGVKLVLLADELF
jgi:hypothetical protein